MGSLFEELFQLAEGQVEVAINKESEYIVTFKTSDGFYQILNVSMKEALKEAIRTFERVNYV